MDQNCEAGIKRLEEEVKSLKAIYPIAASKTKFYVTESEVFNVSGLSTARFRFRPNYGRGKKILVKLTAVEVGLVEFNQSVIFPPQFNEPQDGSGDVIVQVKSGGASYAMYKIKIIASGTTTGVFTRL